MAEQRRGDQLLGSSGLPMVSHGEGVYLFDTEGLRYLDASSGAVTAALGHGDTDLAAALTEQAGKVAFAHRSQFRNAPATELAATLTAVAPNGLERAFFCSSGSEAIEAAMKLAIRYWQERGRSEKTRIVSRRTSYHGSTFGALSATGHAGRRRPFERLLEDLPAFDAPYCYRCPLGLTPDSCQSACLDSLEAALHDLGADRVAAVIAEPVVGAAAGALVPPAGYHERLRALCDRYEALWIADEVMSGIGRTGRWFAVEHWNAVPDLLVAGKGLSAGLIPISAVVCTDDIADVILDSAEGPAVGHTYSNHPVAAAAALAVLQRIAQDGLVKRAEHAGRQLASRLEHCADHHVIVGDVRGVGLLQAVEIVADPLSRRPFYHELHVTAQLVKACREAGLLVYPASGGVDGLSGDAVILAPPLIISDTEIAELVQRFDEALTILTADLSRSPPSSQVCPSAVQPVDAFPSSQLPGGAT